MAAPFKIIVCGEGGQGAKSIAELIAAAAWTDGRHATCLPQFGVEKRGGLTSALTQVSDSPIPYPVFTTADLAVILSQRAVERVRAHVSPRTTVVVNSHLVKDVASLGAGPVFAIDGRAVAAEQLHDSRVFNIVMLGAMLRFLPQLSAGMYVTALDQRFDKHLAAHPDLRDTYRRALELGQELVAPYVAPAAPLPATDPARSRTVENARAVITRWPGRCKSCGLCLARCPVKCIAWDPQELGQTGEPAIKIDPAKCLGCTMCEQICPDFAVKVERK
jgi:Pyruvate/2-oxoacid:ferredoxin oxidoreductase gamma subunit/NAD-dependent dihydropyrimidine dehydrogenase PreA subunit